MCVYVCMCVYMYICVCVCMCVCVCVCECECMSKANSHVSHLVTSFPSGVNNVTVAMIHPCVTETDHHFIQ